MKIIAILLILGTLVSAQPNDKLLEIFGDRFSKKFNGSWQVTTLQAKYSPEELNRFSIMRDTQLAKLDDTSHSYEIDKDNIINTCSQLQKSYSEDQTRQEIVDVRVINFSEYLVSLIPQDDRVKGIWIYATDGNGTVLRRISGKKMVRNPPVRLNDA